MTEDSIEEKTVNELVRSVKQNKGHYAFLIGAGTSKAAGIPTANELIEKWQKERYELECGNLEDEPELDEWVAEKDEDIDQDERYGFWFEQCYPTEADRRRFIRDQVEGENPTFGIIVLATMMSEGIVPVTLTPNFDDLLYDAFYLFLEDKPLIVNHDSLAPQYRLTEDRPTIIKLHGDYLYDNLQNIADETNQLEGNMKKALKRTLEEYGLIVVGYGGRDNSIMSALSEMDISPHGLWCCCLEKEEANNQDVISKKAEKLLEGSNRFLVKISGSEDLFTTLWTELDFDIPVPEEIEDRAEDRADLLRDKIEEQKDQSTGREREALEDISSEYGALATGEKLLRKGDFESAVEVFNKIIELFPENALSYIGRGFAFNKLGQQESAIDDFNKAIELEPEKPEIYLNFAEFLLTQQKPKKALKKVCQSLQLEKDTEELALSLMLKIISKTLLRKEIDDEEYRGICSQEFVTTWEFDKLDSWLEESDVDNKDYIREIIDLLKEHKE